MAGKNVSAQTEESKALSERIKTVRRIERLVLDPMANLIELFKGYGNVADSRYIGFEVDDMLPMLRLMVLGARVELIQQMPGSDLGHYVPASVFEDIIGDWMADIKKEKELEGGAE